MSLSLSHADPAKTSIYAAETGVASLYYSAKLAVNTDGSSRSYHPDDPRAQRLALNNIANAISAIHGPDGSNLDCSPRRGACFQTYIEAFEKARDGKWKPSGTYRIKTDGMIPWKKDAVLGWNVPCTIPSGKSAGYFVSQTSFLLDPSKPVCDQERYLDSLTYNAIVLPRGTKWASQKQIAKDGDLVVVQNLKNRAIAFAIVGDRGPAKDLGEGTIALAARLGQKTLSGQETYGEIKKLALPQVQYLVFPGVSIGKTKAGGFLQSDVDQAGQELLDRWGGISRLDACGTLKRD